MYKYVFKTTERRIHPFPILQVWEDNDLTIQVALADKIRRGFFDKCLEDWLGKDNAANILVRGEEVTLVRETPIVFDFQRFKP